MFESTARCLRSPDGRCRVVCGLGLVALVAVALCGRFMLAQASDPVRLIVYGFSTQEEVFTQALFPAFEQAWEAETGRKLVIEGVFGPSATLAGQINLGAPADVALLSNAQHVNWLKVGRRLGAEAEPVVIGHTPMVIVTRPGNPAAISRFADLTQPGLTLIHADPRTSGAGEWSVLAEYGSALLESGDPAAAQAQLQAIWQNVRMVTPSARGTMTMFELGAGDAFVTYEQDARLALERGVPLEIIVPARTIVAEHVTVIVDDNVTPTERAAAQAFLDYLRGAGLDVLAQYHLRPPFVATDPGSDASTFFTVEDLGGWSQAYREIVETLWESHIEPRLDLEPDALLLDDGGG